MHLARDAAWICILWLVVTRSFGAQLASKFTRFVVVPERDGGFRGAA